MTAERVIGRIIDDAGRDRVEVDVTHDLAKVVAGIDHARPVAALPEASKIAMSLVMAAGDRTLQPRH